ncbi:hypothetical protein ACNUDN_30295 [Mycobacterium sp. smrl_JER01]|uniref:hypothetical protein n=1 Tax=Mycobacterium sp. smrl_JER01 TaxID=3402633 RepID=UPI003AD14F9D
MGLEMLVVDAAVTQFVAARINDGTSSNVIGNLVAVAASVLATCVMGLAMWYSFDSFREKKGKFKQAMPEILGIMACGSVLGLLCLKIPNVFGFSNTFLSDFLPF